MTPELKTLWITDLRQSSHLQGQGGMRTKDGHFCCLGRLCEIKEIPFDEDIHEYVIEDEGDIWAFNDVFPIQFLTAIGLSAAAEAKLTTMNDNDRLTFLQIADWIEQNL